MRIIDDIKLDFKDVLFVPHRSALESRNDVDLNREFKFKHSKWSYEGIPIMASNMDGVGTMRMADTLSVEKIFTCLVKHYSIDELLGFFNDRLHGIDLLTRRLKNTAYSMGTSDNDLAKFKAFTSRTTYDPRYICIDVANGYTQKFIDFIKQFREDNPDPVIIAGNVVTGDMTEALIFAGVDIVKVGIGPGSVCTTRKLTGVGYPQLSAIIECADAAHGLGGHIIADGGCTCPGDIAKAFGANADFVMLGGMLAGHDEGEGQIVTRFYETNEILGASGLISVGSRTVTEVSKTYGQEIKKSVVFYGMSSDTAMNKHNGGVANYRASEGKTVEVEYKGSVGSTIREILGGIRSTCTYVGARTLKELSRRTTFVRVSQQLNEVYGKS